MSLTVKELFRIFWVVGKAPFPPTAARMECCPINTNARYVLWLLDFLAKRGVDTQALVQKHRLTGLLDGVDVAISSTPHRALLSDVLRTPVTLDLG